MRKKAKEALKKNTQDVAGLYATSAAQKYTQGNHRL
jgi:hypothetical protein